MPSGHRIGPQSLFQAAALYLVGSSCISPWISSSPLFFISCSLSDPGNVPLVRAYVERKAVPAPQNRSFCCCSHPFLDFGVGVGEREAASAVVIRSWKVTPGPPLAWVATGAPNVPAVVNAVGMLIQGDKDGGGISDAGELYELLPEVVNRRAAVVLWTDKCVHGNAPRSRSQGAGFLIGWTFINARVFGDIGPQERTFYQIQVRVLWIGAPTHDVTDPVIAGIAFSTKNSFVVDQAVVEVIGIHRPGQHELFVVVQAHDALRFALGLGQRGQQQGSQDGNDGNDDEQFNQGERSILATEKEFHPSRACCKRRVLKQLKVVQHIHLLFQPIVFQRPRPTGQTTGQQPGDCNARRLRQLCRKPLGRWLRQGDAAISQRDYLAKR